ncbi:fatty acyl-AMP ligase [Pantanalinema sp. GBBB05]|uniref:fatty acyl-AMP ligase n=1 Tax=Pantanalinema sp. GBBB05 TaxID=2604139 RepID=UPI001D50C986|nr:fatty acyl-AMP ligase [Pantanalinema sp. GBBB05]
MLLPSYHSLIDLLHDRAHQQPHSRAFTFLKDGELESGYFTYQALDQQARAIATHLQAVAAVGDRVLLVYPFNTCLEFIAALFGCFYAGMIAVPIRPPQKAEEWADFGFRQQECQVQLALTTTGLVDKLHMAWLEWSNQTSDQLLQPEKLSWIATDQPALDAASSWQKPTIDADAIAYFQYTSGSTGVPKAVVITHDNVLQNCINFQYAFPELNFRGLNWLPLTHDMGLVAGIMQTLYAGAETYLMSPIAVFQNPSRWLQAISTYKPTISGGPNFIYDLCVQRVKPEQLPNLDLSSWEIAGNGAEPIRPETLERFAEVFSPYGFRYEAFYLSYGMAEATLVISGGRPPQPATIPFLDKQALEQHRVMLGLQTEPGARPAVSCGNAWHRNRVVIVDPNTLTACSSDGIGEIWVQGAGLSRMYWQRPEQTEQTFQAYLSDTGEGPFLRTGDLGFIHNGEVFITGRLKDMMIFWGLNFYPQTLEQTAEKSHPALVPNGGAAFSVELEGEERLVLMQEIDRTTLRQLNPAQVEEIIGAMRQAIVSEHLVDVYAIALLKPGTLPKTPSGKVQRHRCRAQFLSGTVAAVAEWSAPAPERLNPTDLVQLSGIQEA